MRLVVIQAVHLRTKCIRTYDGRIDLPAQWNFDLYIAPDPCSLFLLYQLLR